jgi:hypothetical protein
VRGLRKTMCLGEGTKWVTTSNLCVEWGLVNGARGVVVFVQCFDGKKPTVDKPADITWVEMDVYTGPAFVKDRPRLVPFTPVTMRCSKDCCTRRQFPGVNGEACTIHKLQGCTVGVGKAIRYLLVDPGNATLEMKMPGLFYVASSRGKKQSDTYYLCPQIDEDRLTAVKNSSGYASKQAELKRIRRMAEDTRARTGDLFGPLDKFMVLVNQVLVQSGLPPVPESEYAHKLGEQAPVREEEPPPPPPRQRTSNRPQRDGSSHPQKSRCEICNQWSCKHDVPGG